MTDISEITEEWKAAGGKRDSSKKVLTDVLSEDTPKSSSELNLPVEHSLAHDVRRGADAEQQQVENSNKLVALATAAENSASDAASKAEWANRWAVVAIVVAVLSWPINWWVAQGTSVSDNEVSAQGGSQVAPVGLPPEGMQKVTVLPLPVEVSEPAPDEGLEQDEDASLADQPLPVEDRSAQNGH
jgi:hypothetical protein